MVFEFKPAGETGMLGAFARSIGASMQKGIITLPAQLGQGYIRGFNTNPAIRMMLHTYTLQEDLRFKRLASAMERDVITLTFHQVVPLTYGTYTQLLPSVQVTSADIPFETFFPAHTPVNTIIIAVETKLLQSMIRVQDHSLLQSMVGGHHSYLYEEIISPEIQAVAAGIIAANVPEALQDFYFTMKAEELVYLFFVELLKREDTSFQSLNAQDVKMLYHVKNKILQQADIPPVLSELAAFARMSESKLKRLFKQVFGSSIYHYYQAYRMKQAAYMLREEKLSVSETGYKLGFSNLSHFTRLFEKHTGMKPKKYALKH